MCEGYTGGGRTGRDNDSEEVGETKALQPILYSPPAQPCVSQSIRCDAKQGGKRIWNAMSETSDVD